MEFSFELSGWKAWLCLVALFIVGVGIAYLIFGTPKANEWLHKPLSQMTVSDGLLLACLVSLFFRR